jgi:hypothetical protein
MNLCCRDQILEVEEKLYLGTLGSLRVEDRLAWQAAIQTRDYTMGCEELTWSGGDGEIRRLTPDMLTVSWKTRPCRMFQGFMTIQNTANLTMYAQYVCGRTVLTL